MTLSDVQFFSPADNAAQGSTPEAAAPKLTGYISSSGKLTLPSSTLDRLGLEASVSAFRVGTDAGKRRIKTLYLVPAQEDAPDGFVMGQGAKSRFIQLGSQLKRNGLDFSALRYRFSVSPFEYEGQRAFALRLTEDKGTRQPKAPYMGKPRGRKKKAQ
ncbi:MAG: hypothetical protein EOO39_16460 [Cytophagaceae bacterium]|nr:MAG: hypothetical protein EOO39_16460 [Cytophagaceae bacterium]